MECMIYFFEQPDPHRLAEAVHKVYGTPHEEIGIIVNDVPEPGTPDHPIVLITHNPITETESTLFEAGGRFAESTGVDTELAIASALSKELHTQSLIAANGLPPDQWVLITSDGGHGTVTVDPDELDEGRIKVMTALEPIPGAPWLPLA